MASSATTNKNRNIGAQLRSILYAIAEIFFWKITSCRTFGAHKLLHSEPFWTTDTNFDTCCLRYIATRTCGKNLYRCTSTYPALNYCSGIFSNPSAIYTKWCAQTFPPIFFWIFAIFDRHFSEFVAPSTNQNENYVVLLKERSLMKKTPKTLSKSAYKRQRSACLNYAPLERTVVRSPDSERDKQKQEAQLMLTTGSTRLAVSRGQQTWYHSTCYI